MLLVTEGLFKRASAAVPLLLLLLLFSLCEKEYGEEECDAAGEPCNSGEGRPEYLLPPETLFAV